jgi:hypothetical protein
MQMITMLIPRSNTLGQKLSLHRYCLFAKRHKTLPAKNKIIDETTLKWTERKEAPKWLQKMAPTKGGRELPTAKEALVIGVVVAVGYYAWFVDPPKKKEEI